MVLERMWAEVFGPRPRGPAGRSERDRRCRLNVELLEGRENPDTTPAAMLDPNLQVTAVLSAGISQPIGIVFLAPNDYLVLEKASGQIKRVTNGALQPTPVLDLAVNSNSERGLLSMVLDPNFATNHFAYVRWTEDSTGADTAVATNVPLTGNRVDRFVWNGATFTRDINLIRLRSLQTDNVQVPGQPTGTTNGAPAGNHNGGVLRFGPDGKLYLFMGDQGRRGWMHTTENSHPRSDSNPYSHNW